MERGRNPAPIRTWNTFGEFDDALDGRRHVRGQRRPGGYPSGLIRAVASRRIVGVPTFVHHLPYPWEMRWQKMIREDGQKKQKDGLVSPQPISNIMRNLPLTAPPRPETKTKEKWKGVKTRNGDCLANNQRHVYLLLYF